MSTPNKNDFSAEDSFAKKFFIKSSLNSSSEEIARRIESDWLASTQDPNRELLETKFIKKLPKNRNVNKKINDFCFESGLSKYESIGSNKIIETAIIINIKFLAYRKTQLALMQRK